MPATDKNAGGTVALAALCARAMPWLGYVGDVQYKSSRDLKPAQARPGRHGRASFARSITHSPQPGSQPRGEANNAVAFGALASRTRNVRMQVAG